MSGDYTRFTYKPQKRYSSVLMQQGRVQLDSDWNEQGEILKRRWELQAMDVFGKCAVPEATTPDGFKITGFNGSDDFEIGVGRMYLDGLLPENFAQGPAVSYLTQPFYPDPPHVPSVQVAEALVYIDVWEREITYVQDRDLLEKALLGVDTATRVQTVWQVKVQERANCRWDLDKLFPPSAARLSSRAVQSPSSEDPCILPAATGYRGPENRLYRVEIHDPGNPQDGLSSIRFKWSRENASVVSSVEAISSDRLQVTVSRIGRDKVLRFKIGDWVEVLDDHRELMQQAGQMARVVDIDEANRTLTLNHAVDGNFDSGDPLLRHTRVTRWDQSEPKNSLDFEGLMTGKDDWITLEDGVEIRLSLPSGKAHVADYWSFAARTVDALVEELVEASPRGIIHHYCKLAALSNEPSGGVPGGHVDDCRHLYNPCGTTSEHDGNGHEVQAACCVTVAPGSDIQEAINSLLPGGGCVCLADGDHPIDATINIAQSNVILHGESLGAHVVGTNGLVTLLRIGKADTVKVHDIWFDASGARAKGPVIDVRSCHHATIEDCRIEGPGSATDETVVAGVDAFGCALADMCGNELQSLEFGIQVDQSEVVRIAENRMGAAAPAGADNSLSTVGIRVSATSNAFVRPAAWHIEGNLIEGFKTGVFIDGQVDRCQVIGNQILRGSKVLLQPSTLPLNPLAILVDGSAIDPKHLLDSRIYGVDVNAPNAVVYRNTIKLSDPTHGGVRATGIHTCIEANRISSDYTPALVPPEVFFPLGILLGPRLASSAPPDYGIIRANVLTGCQDGIVVVGRGIQGVLVKDNQVGRSDAPALGQPRLGVALKATNAAQVMGNQINRAERAVSLSAGSRSRVLHNRFSDGRVGVLAYANVAESELEVSHNVIENMELPGIVGSRLIGAATLSHNRLIRCGYKLLPGVPGINPPSAGIYVESHGHLRLESCEVLDTGVSPLDGELGATPAVGVHGRTQSCQIANNRVAYSITLTPSSLAHRALLLLNLQETEGAGHAAVVGNSMSGPGMPNLVQVDRVPHSAGFEKIQFNDNQCEHTPGDAPHMSDVATVSLTGEHLIVMGNHVKAVPKIDSMNFHTPAKLALMGNVTTGALVALAQNPNLAPPNWTDFNILLP